jgi:predicted DNA-binding transcriptional regulator
MPTLDISEGTLRENVRELMKRNLLLREVVNNKAYYRPSDDWLLAEVNNVKAMSIKDKLKYMSEEEKQELLSLL